MTDNPLISVVTPVYNGERYIENAIKSVENQSYGHCEHLVADGNSTDGTVDILERHPSVEYVSEKDDGLYDALNTTIEMANGDFICWVNADDLLAKGALESLVKAYTCNPDTDFVAGNSELFREEDDKQVRVRGYDFTSPKKFSKGEITHDGSAICGCLIASDLLDNIGLFESEFEVAGDIEFLLRLASSELNCAKIDRVVYRYRGHEASLTFGDGDLGGVSKRGSEEVVRFLPEYIHNKDVPKTVRAHALDLFRAKVAMLMYDHVKGGNLGDTARLFRHALAVDREWPLWASRTVTRRYGPSD